MYGIGNIIQNSIEHANNIINIEIDWDENFIKIKISDDGEGFTLDILDKVGNPYITSKKNQNNMGLGIFISKNLTLLIIVSSDKFLL